MGDVWRSTIARSPRETRCYVCYPCLSMLSLHHRRKAPRPLRSSYRGSYIILTVENEKRKAKSGTFLGPLSRGGPLHRRKRCLRKEPNKMNKTPRHDHHYINGTFESWTQNKTRTHTSRSNTSNNSSLQDREREAPFALGSGSTTCGAETLTNHIEAR